MKIYIEYFKNLLKQTLVKYLIMYSFQYLKGTQSNVEKIWAQNFYLQLNLI